MQGELIIIGLLFLVAIVYSSVGHGGASGYLAVLSFYTFSHEVMATSALCLNLLVAGASLYSFSRAKHFSWSLTWPFVALSIPAAFAGGLMKIPPKTYALLLCVVLAGAGLRLFFDSVLKNRQEAVSKPPLPAAFVSGGVIGLLSGMAGVGGGIFLSPIMLFFRWAGPKQTAAASAFFILVNSLAGLTGRLLRWKPEHLETRMLFFMVVAAFAGGLLGSRLGAHHFSAIWLKRILSVVLFIASFKLLRFI